jgi:REP element-mobilizing transposase RayT
MARGVDGREIFHDDKDRHLFLLVLRQLQDETGCSIVAYCLMDNHFHFAIRVSATPLSKVLQRLLTRYAKSFNLKYGRTGHLFQARFKSILCLDDPYLLSLIRYIHRNPVRAGLVTDPSDWRWSSYSHYVGRPGLIPIESSAVPHAEMGAIDRGAFDAWMPSVPARPTLLREESRELESIAAIAERFTNPQTLKELRGPSRSRTASDFRRRFIMAAVKEQHSLTNIARWLNRSPSSIHVLLYGRNKQNKQKPDTVGRSEIPCRPR